MDRIGNLAKLVLSMKWGQHYALRSGATERDTRATFSNEQLQSLDQSQDAAHPPRTATPPSGLSPFLTAPTPTEEPPSRPTSFTLLPKYRQIVVAQARLLLLSLVHLSPAVQVALRTLSEDPLNEDDCKTVIPPFLDVLTPLTSEDTSDLVLEWGTGPELIVARIKEHGLYFRRPGTQPRRIVYLQEEHIVAAARILADHDGDTGDNSWRFEYNRHIVFITGVLFHEGGHWFRAQNLDTFHYSPPRLSSSNTRLLPGSTSWTSQQGPKMESKFEDTEIRERGGEAGAWGEDATLGGKLGRFLVEGSQEERSDSYRIAKLLIRQPLRDVNGGVGPTFTVPDTQVNQLMALLPQIRNIADIHLAYSDPSFLDSLRRLHIHTFLPFSPVSPSDILTSNDVRNLSRSGIVKMREISETGTDKEVVVDEEEFVTSFAQHLSVDKPRADLEALDKSTDLESMLASLQV